MYADQGAGRADPVSVQDDRKRTSPFDSFLVLRGIKTLSVRVERQQENAMKIADWLKEQKKVTDVYYVGLPEHPGYEINQKQSRGAGSMIRSALIRRRRRERCWSA